MEHEHHYTLGGANDAIPAVRAQIERLRAAREGLNDEEARAALEEAGPGNGGAAAAHDDRLEQLERLGRLHDAGTIDDDEFKVEKQRILSAAAP